MTIQVKRVYEPLEPDDGMLFLVDRLWPRGGRKESLILTGWLKDLAPSNALRQWFGHEPEKWHEFCHRYEAELVANREAWQSLLDLARQGTVTLLFSAHDKGHNNAVALQMFLSKQLKSIRH